MKNVKKYTNKLYSLIGEISDNSQKNTLVLLCALEVFLLRIIFFVFLFIDEEVITTYIAIASLTGSILILILVLKKNFKVGRYLLIFEGLISGVLHYIFTGQFMLYYLNFIFSLYIISTLRPKKRYKITLLIVFILANFIFAYAEPLNYVFLNKNILLLFYVSISVLFVAAVEVNSYSNNLYISNMSQDLVDLNNLAYRDTLTGLLNRRGLTEKFKEIEDETVVFCYIDIDYFKKINDTYGHIVGDKILKSLAGFFRASVRKMDIVARWGGEEFLIVFSGTNVKHVVDKMNRMRNNLKEANIVVEDNKEIVISITVGVSEFTGNMEKTLKVCDDYLYYGKIKGRDRVISKKEFIRRQG